jgi:hypothetical protein
MRCSYLDDDAASRKDKSQDTSSSGHVWNPQTSRGPTLEMLEPCPDGIVTSHFFHPNSGLTQEPEKARALHLWISMADCALTAPVR